MQSRVGLGAAVASHPSLMDHMCGLDVACDNGGVPTTRPCDAHDRHPSSHAVVQAPTLGTAWLRCSQSLSSASSRHVHVTPSVGRADRVQLADQELHSFLYGGVGDGVCADSSGSDISDSELLRACLMVEQGNSRGGVENLVAHAGCSQDKAMVQAGSERRERVQGKESPPAVSESGATIVTTEPFECKLLPRGRTDGGNRRLGPTTDVRGSK